VQSGAEKTTKLCVFEVRGKVAGAPPHKSGRPLGDAATLVLQALLVRAALPEPGESEWLALERAASKNWSNELTGRGLVATGGYGTRIRLMDHVTSDVAEWASDAARAIANPSSVPPGRLAELIDLAQRWIAPAASKVKTSTALGELIEQRGARRRELLFAVAESHPDETLQQHAARAHHRIAPGESQPQARPAAKRERCRLANDGLPDDGSLIGRSEEIAEIVDAVRSTWEEGGVIAITSKLEMGRRRVAREVLKMLAREGFTTGSVAGDPGAAMVELYASIEGPSAAEAPADMIGAVKKWLNDELDRCVPWCIAYNPHGHELAGAEVLKIAGGVWLVTTDRTPRGAVEVNLAEVSASEIASLLVERAGADKISAREAGELARRLGGAPGLAAHVAQLLAEETLDARQALALYRSVDLSANRIELVPTDTADLARDLLDSFGQTDVELIARLALLADHPVPDDLLDALDESGGTARERMERWRDIRVRLASSTENIALQRVLALVIRRDLADFAQTYLAVAEALGRIVPRYPPFEEQLKLPELLPHVRELLDSVRDHPRAAAPIADALLGISEALWARGRRQDALGTLDLGIEHLPDDDAFASSERARLVLHRAEIRSVGECPDALLEEARQAADAIGAEERAMMGARVDAAFARVARAHGACDVAEARLTRAIDVLCADSGLGGSSPVERAMTYRHLAEVMQDRATTDCLARARELVAAGLGELTPQPVPAAYVEDDLRAAVSSLANSPAEDRYAGLTVLRVAASVERAAGDSIGAGAILDMTDALAEGMPRDDSRLLQVSVARALLAIDAGDERRAVELARETRAAASRTIGSTGGIDEGDPWLLVSRSLLVEAHLTGWQIGRPSPDRDAIRAALSDLPADAAFRPAVGVWHEATLACAHVLARTRSAAKAAVRLAELHDRVAAVRGAASEQALKLMRWRWLILAESATNLGKAADGLADLAARVGAGREAGLVTLASARVDFMADARPGDVVAKASRAEELLADAVGPSAPATAAATGLRNQAS
jgi:hypothetical protein